MNVVLTRDGDLTLQQIEAVACAKPAPRVALDPAARQWLADMRQAAMAAIAIDPDRPIYGFNRGFGSNVRYAVGHGLSAEARAEALRTLQTNLILSHAANTGPLAPAEVVRATMLLRASSLARGHSTVRPEVVETLIEMLNAGVTPAVPRHGSVSASGDLAPLSHVAAVVMGEGRVLLDEKGRAAFGAEMVTTRRYLAEAPKHGLPTFTPLALEMKEGLALNNGCQYSAAWGALATVRMRRLLETATVATALGVQAMLGAGRPFRADLHALRAHPGSRAVAAWIFDLLEGYPFRDATADEKANFDGDIQDPYNLRCAAQILGPCLDLIARAEATLTCEANSVTDNPIDLNEDPASYSLDEIVSGGHFHGMAVAVDVYGLLQAAGIMARLSNMRCARYVDSKRNKGLGPQVRGDAPEATESGLLMAEYATAGLCNHIWGLAMPSHLMSVSTDSGQEDHVSMAANVAMRAHEAVERLSEVLAIELTFASQAMQVRAEAKSVTTRALDPAPGGEAPADVSADWGGATRKVSFEKAWTTPLEPAAYQPGRLTEPAIKAIRKTFAPVSDDRELSWDVMILADQVLSGVIAAATGYRFPRH